MTADKEKMDDIEKLANIAQEEFGYTVQPNNENDRLILVSMESGENVSDINFRTTEELATFLLIRAQEEDSSMSVAAQLLDLVDPRTPLLNLNDAVTSDELLSAILERMKAEDWAWFRNDLAHRSKRFLEAGDVHFQRLKLQELPEAQGTGKAGKRL